MFVYDYIVLQQLIYESSNTCNVLPPVVTPDVYYPTLNKTSPYKLSTSNYSRITCDQTFQPEKKSFIL